MNADISSADHFNYGDFPSDELSENRHRNKNGNIYQTEHKNMDHYDDVWTSTVTTVPE